MTARVRAVDCARAYDRVADAWRDRRTAPSPSLVRLLDDLLASLPVGAAVLDVGCGSGVPVARRLAERGLRVTGIDASARLLDHARAAVPSATFVLGDMRTVALDGPFDAIVAWDSVFHVPRADHATLFARFHAWLRPGAPLLLSLGGSAWEGTSAMLGETFFYSGHAPAVARAQLADAGFAVRHFAIDDPASRGHLAIMAARHP